MKPPQESITLRALDRLPPAEAREAEAAIAENPELARQLREVEDIAAHLWHAASPLHSAPAEIWENIEREIQPSPRRNASATLRNVTLALGWAAALVLLLVLLLRGEPSSRTDPPRETSRPADPLTPKPHAPRGLPLPPKSPEQDRSLSPAERRLRAQLHDLRERLARFEEDPDSTATRPRIVPLHPPGISPPGDDNRAGAHVLSLITSALANDLRRRQERATDLVIEQGWKPDLFLDAPPDTLIRHRSFLGAAEKLEFLIADDGRYYDPASGFVWSPAEDGGGYLGRRADPDLDLALFFPPEPSDEAPPRDPLVAQDDPDPRGYLIEDPTTREATLIVEELPAQPPGSALLGQFFSANGSSIEYHLTALQAPGGVTAVPIPREANVTNSTSFNFVTRRPDGTTQVILSNRSEP